jgi:hypothetical protein
MERQALRDDQFARIEHLLPGRPGTVGRNSDLGNRLFVDAVIWNSGWEDRGAICQNVLAAGAIRTSVSPAGR